ncbi:Transposase and inactivated derivatives [Chromobacterium violaceum]|uniref:Transposase and inactivated derivatives n=1 Tax=Chromobacterium violaceum TaxID=536 RepID=A0A447TDZ2_CHRVL|nr:Transposase and inactivated derivatives [Chromobacterium violaceum]
MGSLSEKIGRRNAITLAALFALPVLPLWRSPARRCRWPSALSDADIGAGRLGRDTAHLNEISPPAVRATFPGLVYQLGNLLASVNSPLQAHMAKTNGGDYGLAMAIVAGIVALAIAILIRFSHERRERRCKLTSRAYQDSNSSACRPTASCPASICPSGTADYRG